LSVAEIGRFLGGHAWISDLAIEGYLLEDGELEVL
jgi:hypothetical protein